MSTKPKGLGLNVGNDLRHFWVKRTAVPFRGELELCRHASEDRAVHLNHADHVLALDLRAIATQCKVRPKTWSLECLENRK